MTYQPSPEAARLIATIEALCRQAYQQGWQDGVKAASKTIQSMQKPHLPTDDAIVTASFRHGSLSAKAYRYIQAYPGATRTEVIRGLVAACPEIAPNSVRVILRRLRKRGLVRLVGKGFYVRDAAVSDAVGGAQAHPLP
jgi:hypothetical protein